MALDEHYAPSEKQKENVERLTLEKEEIVKRILDMEYEKTETETKLKGLEAEAANKELTEEERAAVQAIMDQISAVTQEKETVNAEQLSLEEEKTGLQETLTNTAGNNEAEYLSDGVHPAVAGAKLIASEWLNAFDKINK